jgi:hypothetical protein
MSAQQIHMDLQKIDRWISTIENKMPKSVQRDYNKTIEEIERLQIKPKILFQMDLPRQDPLMPMLQEMDTRTRETELVLKQTFVNLTKLAEAMVALQRG